MRGSDGPMGAKEAYVTERLSYRAALNLATRFTTSRRMASNSPLVAKRSAAIASGAPMTTDFAPSRKDSIACSMKDHQPLERGY